MIARHNIKCVQQHRSIDIIVDEHSSSSIRGFDGLSSLCGRFFVSGAFDAEVHPELPPANTILGLLKYFALRAQEAVLNTRYRGGGGLEAATTSATTTITTGNAGGWVSTSDGDGHGYLVRSVPVQTSRIEVGCLSLLRRHTCRLFYEGTPSAKFNPNTPTPDVDCAHTYLVYSGN